MDYTTHIQETINSLKQKLLILVNTQKSSEEFSNKKVADKLNKVKNNEK